MGRVKDLESMVFRTAERKQRREFREGGRRNQALQRDLQIYISAPRAASFAVTFRVGTSQQMALPGMDFVREVVDEVLDCMDMFSIGREEQLKERIPDPAYFRNFVGLARKLAPDGEEISTVGITAIRGNSERRVML